MTGLHDLAVAFNAEVHHKSPYYRHVLLSRCTGLDRQPDETEALNVIKEALSMKEWPDSGQVHREHARFRHFLDH